MPWLCFEDITRKKFGLLKTKRRDIWFRIFVLVLNIIATPILLVVHSISIYLLPCIASSVVGCCFRSLFSKICWPLTKGMLYSDNNFPPNAKSLGNVKTNSKVTWLRSSEMKYEKEVMVTAKGGGVPTKEIELCQYNRMVEGGMDPEDICQGALGNCWLLSAMASLSSTTTTLEECFVTNEWNPRGKYTVRFWDDDSGKYVNVCVDDYFPVDDILGTPVFVQPNGNELWVMVLEKAFAKFMGSYAATEGGYPLFAMRAITGDEVASFNYDGSGNWKRLEMTSARNVSTKEIEVKFSMARTQKRCQSNEMYEILAHYHQQGFVLAAGTKGQDKTIEDGRSKDGGIVPGHAYTILQVYSPKFTLKSGIRLVKLRNPWGSFEWKGDWSDESPLWKKHPTIKLEMGQFDFFGSKVDSNDGCFYMSWDDFLRHFDTIDVCYVQRDMSSLKLDVIEEAHVCGPLVGCVIGCLQYWLCCSGFSHLWCSTTSTKEANKAKEQFSTKA